MNILTNIKNFFSPTLEVKHSAVVTQDYFSQIMYDSINGNGTVSIQQAFQYYKENAAVATSVDKIASAVEHITPVLKIDDEFVTDHELLTLLRNPNGFDDYKEFIGSFCRYYLLTHNSFVISLGNYKFPSLELYAINPMNASIVPNQDSYPQYYNVNNTVSNGNYNRTIGTRGEITRFINETGMSEVYHLMGFTAEGNNIQGDSPLNSIMGEIRSIIKGNEHNVSMLDNSISPSLLINYNDNPSQEELDARVINFKDTKEGAKRAGLPIFTASDGKDAGTTITNFGTTNKDMDYAKLTEQANEAIYSKYNIPLPLVTLKASTYNNIENAIVDFYENTVTPELNTLLSGLTKFLVPKYPDLKGRNVQITFIEADIKSLMASKIKDLKERASIGIETINELRELLPNRDEIEQGEVLSGATVTASADIDEEAKRVLTQEAKRVLTQEDGK